MKHWIVIISVAAIAMPLASCRKAESPQKYDKKVDGPPSVVQVAPNKTIVGDQGAISRAMEAARAAVPADGTQATGPAAATAPAEETSATAPAEEVPATVPADGDTVTTEPAAAPDAAPDAATVPTTPTDTTIETAPAP